MTTVDRTQPAGIEDVLALSPLQEGFFSLARIADEGVDLYTMQFVMEIVGPVDLERLQRSFDEMFVRHPNLRASFWDQDLPRPVQIVPTWVDVPWSEFAVSAHELDELERSERRRNFDLSRGPLWRVVIATAGESRRLILTAHHILLDGWAMAVFFRELIAIYDSGAPELLPTPRPYRDYIGWLAQQDTAAATKSWVDYLDRVSAPLMLAEGDSAQVGRVVPESTRFELDPESTATLRTWSRKHGLTLNTVTQFAWAVVLGALTDRDDVVFGTTVSGRPESLAGVETMIGLFINAVPMAVRLDRSASIVEQCAALQRESAAMREQGFLGLSTVQRAAGHGALFDTLLVFENAPIGAATAAIHTRDGAQFVPKTMESLAHYPLTVVAYVLDETLVVELEAVPAALPHFSAADIGARLLAVLRRLPDSNGVGELDPLLPGERADLLRLATTPALDDVSDVGIAEQFARQAARTPEAIALTTAAVQFTYAELAAAAGALSAELTARGIGAESVVALALPRSERSIIAILATLAAGAAYVPVDVAAPISRIESVLRQSAPDLVVSVRDTAPLLGDFDVDVFTIDDPALGLSAEFAPVAARPDQCAYLIFTSGSTGEPKGVMGTHAALSSYFADHRNRVYRPAVARLGRKLRIAHAWSLSFDASWQPLVGLLDGHEIHMFDSAEMRDAQGVVDGIAARRIDMIDTSPSMFAQLSDAGLLGDRSSAAQLSVLALGGEAIGPQLWAQLQVLPDTDVYNCYGPTETTVEALVGPVTAQRGSSLPPNLGGPTAGTTAYVLDSHLRLSPIGVVGELYLAGGQLTRGYVERRANTADRFVADPFAAGRRMYRTGDLVRRLPTGELTFLGRVDDQVKIRGYRVELGDIEAELRRLSGVSAAAVVVVRRAAGPALVGFVVASGKEPAKLRTELGEHLPAYMVPTRLVVLASLPITSNGKLDTRELVDAAAKLLVAGSASDPGALPRTDTEKALAGAFAEVLGGPAPGIDEDFFDLGMDSVVAISLVNRLRRQSVPVSPRMVLATPTIRDLAAAIDAAALRATATEHIGYGEIETVPNFAWMFRYGSFRRACHTMALTLPPGVSDADLALVLQAVLDGHDMLRSRLVETSDGPRVVTREPGIVRAADILVTTDADIAQAARAAVDGLDPHGGAMVRAVRLVRDSGELLLLAVHHLAVDAVSWRVLFADLADAWSQLTETQSGVPVLPPEPTPFRDWAQALCRRADAPEVLEQRDYWVGQVAGDDPVLGERYPDPTTDTWSMLKIAPADSTVETTRVLLGKSGQLRELLLTALTTTIATWRAERGQDGAAGMLVALGGHGREDEAVGGAVDTANTVGWFTTLYPVRLGAGHDRASPDSLMDAVTAELDEVPHGGVDYGSLAYTNPVPELAHARDPQVAFNYLGRFDLGGPDVPLHWLPSADNAVHQQLPIAPEPDFPLRFAVDVYSAIRPTVAGPQLVTSWRWNSAAMTADQANRLAVIWQETVEKVAASLQFRTS